MELLDIQVDAISENDLLLPKKSFAIAPLGDIQWDPEVCAVQLLKDHIQYVMDNYDNVYWIGMGDYIDFMSPSNRKRYKNADLYDTSAKGIDASAKTQVDELYEKALYLTKGKWLGLLEGHHYHNFLNGTTTDQYLAGLLDTKFLGSCTMIELHFADQSRRVKGSMVIWAHHGVGGGTTIGAPLNKLEKIANQFDADIFLMGHVHKKAGAPITRIRKVGMKIVEREMRLVITGSFLKGYKVGHTIGDVPRGPYPEQFMMNPIALGGVVLRVWPKLTHASHGRIVPIIRVDC